MVDVFYFLVQLTQCFLEDRQPAVSVSCAQDNLAHIIFNLGKMQLLVADRRQVSITSTNEVLMPV